VVVEPPRKIAPLIVENHITEQSYDKQEIEPTFKQLNAVEGNLGKPDGLLADMVISARAT